MYEIPTQTNVERCIITEDVVNGKAAPEYVYNENRKPLQRMRKRKSSRGNSCLLYTSGAAEGEASDWGEVVTR